MEGINVVSCFDGMGCLMIALKELGIKVNKYFAYEIDKFAIEQTKHNFPDIIHLGSITNASLADFQGLKIDLIAGGSPCQGFSFAGKQLNFDDPRSKLFFDFVKLVNLVKSDNPNAYFLLENVNMKKEYLRVISEHMGVFPVNINAALVSAQNRERWFWTNIKTKKIGLFDEVYVDIPQPKDRGILLKDILENEADEKYYLSDKMLNYFERNNIKQKENKNGFSFNPHINIDVKSKSITTKEGGRMDDNYICVAMRGRNVENQNHRTKGIELEQRLELNTTGKTNCLTSVSKDNLIMQINPSLESGGKQPYQQNRIYDSEGIVPALCANKADLIIAYKYNQDAPVSINKEKFDCLRVNAGGKLRGVGLDTGYRIRRLTPTECASLQSVPSWYKWIVSDSQQYKMLGNGWNIEVIKHNLSFMKI